MVMIILNIVGGLCAAYMGYIFLMMAMNKTARYQEQRKNLVKNLNFTDYDGAYYLFAFIGMIGFLRMLYKVMINL